MRRGYKGGGVEELILFQAGNGAAAWKYAQAAQCVVGGKGAAAVVALLATAKQSSQGKALGGGAWQLSVSGKKCGNCSLLVLLCVLAQNGGAKQMVRGSWGLGLQVL